MYRETFAASIPFSNLASMTVGVSYPYSSDIWPVSSLPLIKLVARSKNLRALTLKTSSQIFDSRFGRLPPIQSLCLNGCYCPSTEQQISQTWDFSQLQCLTIHGKNVYITLSTFPLEALSSLKELILRKKGCFYTLSESRGSYRSSVGTAVTTSWPRSPGCLVSCWVYQR